MASKTSITIHYVFATKYRRDFMTPPGYAAEVEQLMRSTAQYYGLELHAIKALPDHVHALVTVPPRHSTAYAAGKMQWWASLNMRRRHPELKERAKAFFSPRYFARSVSSGGDRQLVEQYIKDNEEIFA